VRAAVLVTGMSGTGTTTALRALASRGHRVVVYGVLREEWVSPL
jgi:predicted ATPase